MITTGTFILGHFRGQTTINTVSVLYKTWSAPYYTLYDKETLIKDVINNNL